MAHPAQLVEQFPIHADVKKGHMTHASLNPRRTHLACVHAYPDDSFHLSICSFSSGSWLSVCTSDSIAASCLCWSMNDVLAVGSSNGEIQVAFSIHDDLDGEESIIWKPNLQAFVRPGVAIVEMGFAPRCFGLKLAVAFCDGRVVILAPELPFRPEVWVVEGTLPVPGGLDVTGASWRSSLPGEPEAICVGTSLGILIFWKSDADTWRLACETLESGRPIYSISWAPTSGRAFDLIASASGTKVIIWCLVTGSDGHLTLSIDKELDLHTPISGGAGCLLWSTSGYKLAVQSQTGPVWVLEQEVTGNWSCKEKV